LKSKEIKRKENTIMSNINIRRKDLDEIPMQKKIRNKLGSLKYVTILQSMAFHLDRDH
jgi:hypothetical protein